MNKGPGLKERSGSPGMDKGPGLKERSGSPGMDKGPGVAAVPVLRYLTAGESHGQALVAVLEGMPAGVPVTTAEIAAELARGRLVYGRGARMRFEADRLEVLGGVRHGRTLGSPVAVLIGNSEWPKWTEVMAPDPVAGEGAGAVRRGAPPARP